MLACLAGILTAPTVSATGLSWPDGQYLPTLSPPAPIVDLIDFDTAIIYQAEGAGIAHLIGRADGAGWSANVAQDASGTLCYGPYVANIPVGLGEAGFSMMIDSISGADDVVARIDVHDFTTSQVLAAKDIKRSAFSDNYRFQKFTIRFNNAAAGHSLEFRVFWYDKAYLNVDYITYCPVQMEEELLFSSLQGVVNGTQPRIALSYQEDGKGRDWLTRQGISYTVIDRWAALQKYRNEVDGIVIYDPNLPDTVNVATTIAGARNAVIAAPSQVATLTASPYSFTIVDDLRGRFNDKYAAYNYMYVNYWPQCNHRCLAGLFIADQTGALSAFGQLRDYLIATKTAVFWLDPANQTDRNMAAQFFTGLTAGNGTYLGWWPNEGAGVRFAQGYGIPTVASDWFKNASLYGGLSRALNIPFIPAKPTLENKIYVAFMMSEGDNAQYVANVMGTLWQDPNRGAVPISWTTQPILLDLAPQTLNYFYNTATPNDCLMAGPSGAGYVYADELSQANLDLYTERTAAYCQNTGIKVINVWDTVTSQVGTSFGRFSPSLLGLISFDPNNGYKLYNGLPMMAAPAPYQPNEADLKARIETASQAWSGVAPMFIAAQGQAWHFTPTSFLNIKDQLDPDKYVFVRADHLAMLYKEFRENRPIVALRARANNKYVCADNGGASPLIANRTFVEVWESFELYDLGGGKIALRSLANDKFVCAETDGTEPLIANRDNIGLWETFDLITNADGTKSLRAEINDKYVCAEDAGASPLIANRTAIGSWEKFDLIIQ